MHWASCRPVEPLGISPFLPPSEDKGQRTRYGVREDGGDRGEEDPMAWAPAHPQAQSCCPHGSRTGAPGGQRKTQPPWEAPRDSPAG